MTAPRQARRLATETSPYLIQHAHDPVDWYPWGEEALARARATDRPIFLSIGYAACHWCHVMERESFEDEVTAADLARDFVAIKVDREERPDLDAVYMAAVQAMTGRGGWPMSVFLTPDGRPFYGGTYFPDRPRHGMPSFRQVLAGVAEAWRERRAEVEEAASRLAEHLRGAPAAAAHTGVRVTAPAPGDALHDARLRAATASLSRDFDPRHGGWGRAPRFPAPMVIEHLLREHLRLGGDRAGRSAPKTDDAGRSALAMATRTLDAMAAGGIHDQLGGGFARYATDAAWLVPHFEKMLYDNAQLARVYLHAWQITGRTDYREVARRTLDFMARELRVPADGAFASSLDADTEGHEGATYVWTAAQIREELGQDAPLFEAAHGVTEAGNWEGHSILSRVRDDGDLARDFDLSEDQVIERLARARERLLARRGRRAQPARDDKVLAAWNGLALGAFAEAGRLLAEERYGAIAREAADFLLRTLRTADGRLLRSWKDGRAQHAGVLEDHADLADGLLALYETTFEERWFDAARELVDRALEHFARPEGGFFDTAEDAEVLIVRPRGLVDDALPSGSAMLTCVLLRLAALTGEGRYRESAEAALGPMLDVAPGHPAAFAQWLIGMSLAERDIDEVAIVGDPASPDTRALLEVVRNGHRPWQVVALAADPEGSHIALLEGRERLDGRATAYVCRRFACGRPVGSAHELAAQLGGA